MIEEHNPDFSKPPPVSFPDVFPAMSSRKPGLVSREGETTRRPKKSQVSLPYCPMTLIQQEAHCFTLDDSMTL